jgi:uncharacterized membrane protein
MNVAPTDEVRIIGAEADVPLLLATIAATLVITLGIVFVVDLPGGRGGSMLDARGGGPLETPVGETIAAYGVALLVSFVLLWAFGLAQGLGFQAVIGHVVMLGTLAAFGSAAARLLVSGESGERDGSAA